MTGTKRILLVEDHRSLSDSLAYLLNREPGLEVVGQVASAAECRKFASSGKGFDVAILDLLLPDAYGPELIRELLENCPWASVLVLTGSAKSEDRERALAEGAGEILLKTAPIEELVDAVKRLGGVP